MNLLLKSTTAALALAVFSYAPTGEARAEGCYHGVTLVTNFNKPVKVKKTFALSVPGTPATKKKKRR